MKRFVYHIILMFSMLVIAYPARASIELRIIDNSGYVGDTVLVAINTSSSVTDSSIFAYQLELSYSTNYFKPVGVSTAGSLTEGWGDPQMNEYEPGRLKLSAAGATALEGQGTLVFVKFRLLRAGNVTIYFANSGFNMLNEGQPELELVNGRVNILAKPFITVRPNQGVIPIGVTLQFYSSQGASPYVYTVTDESVASISSTGLLTGLRRGFVYVVSTDQNGVADSTDNLIEVVPFSMTIRDTSYFQNQWVDIPVNISSLNVEDVYSGNVSVIYNNVILQAEEVITTGTLLESVGVVEYNTESQGKVTVSFADSDVITGQGVLFYIRFKIADRNAGGTHLSLENVIFNEELFAEYDNGYFSIIALPPLNVTPKTGTLFVGETLDFNVTGGTAPYTWSVSVPGYANINSSGLLTALSGGDVVISAVDIYGSMGSSNVISIYDGELIVAEVQAPQDAPIIHVPINISALEPGKEIVSFSGEVDFTPTKTHNYELDKTGAISETWASASNTNDDVFKFAMAGVTASSGGDILATLTLMFGEGAAVGNVIPVVLDNVVANEGSPRLLVDHGSVTVSNPTSVEDNEFEKLSVFPNPSSGEIRFICESLVTKIDVYSVTGIKVKTFVFKNTRSSDDIDLSEVGRGVYILQFYTNKGELLYKKVKLN